MVTNIVHYEGGDALSKYIWPIVTNVGLQSHVCGAEQIWDCRWTNQLHQVYLQASQAFENSLCFSSPCPLRPQHVHYLTQAFQIPELPVPSTVTCPQFLDSSTTFHQHPQKILLPSNNSKALIACHQYTSYFRLACVTILYSGRSWKISTIGFDSRNIFYTKNFMMEKG